MLHTRLLSLLPLLPLAFSAPVPAPLLGLDNLAAADGILDPLLKSQDLAIPPPPLSSPSDTPGAPALGPGGLLSGLLGDNANNDDGLLGSLVDTILDITGPLNISLGLNTTILGTDLDLGLNIQLGDDEELICGSVSGVWDSTMYDLKCVCWSVERGIVIDAQVGADIGLGEREGLDAFLRAQIQFGGQKFAYPAYAEPTCDGSGGFNCPGGRQPNGKCSAFLAAKPRPRPVPATGAAAPTPTPAAVAAVAAVPTATDLQSNSAPPSTISAVATTISAAVATVSSPNAPQAQALEQDQTFGIQAVPAVAAAVTQFGTTTTTSMSTETVVLPATVFVEMITTTELSTVYATVTETSTSVSTSTSTVTQTSTQTQWATTTATVSTCTAAAQDEQINVNSVPQPTTTNAGYTPPPAPASSTTTASSATSINSPTPELAIAATPTSAAATSGSTGQASAPTPTPAPNTDGDDDDAFSGPRVIDLAKPQAHGSGASTCPEGQVWGTTMCCRADQVEVDGECKCHDGFENIIDVCLRLCIGDRLPSGECSILGLGLDLGVGLGGLEL
ncbi:hypothetical protein IAU59_001379 [Kwoniella sp. CBS 9459]